MKRRRLRPGFGLLLLIALLVLIGQGLGLLGDGGEKQGQPSPETKTSSIGAARGPGEAKPAAPPGAAKPAPDAGTRSDPGVAPAVEAPPPRPEPAHAVKRPGAGVERDRFGSLLSLVTTRTQAGQLGDAHQALEHLRTLPLDESQLTTSDAAARELDRALAAACGKLALLLGQGQVLSGNDAIRQLLPAGATSMPPRLAESLRPFGLGEGLLRVPVQGGRPWPTPAPLARDRNVRVRVGAEFQSARVIDSRSDQVTLRVQGAQGVTFPTMAVVVCEPVEPTAAEATEMGLAALHAGDGLLARLWLAAASLRSKEARAARTEQLADLLR